MTALALDAIRRQVRALDYVRGTPTEAAMWREDDADSRANLAIEGMALETDEHLLFDMLRDETERAFGLLGVGGVAEAREASVLEGASALVRARAASARDFPDRGAAARGYGGGVW